MPPRSVKMKRFIFGFQRRVWWPKWTPASRSSRMETTAKALGPFPGLVGATAGGARAEPTLRASAPPPVLPAGEKDLDSGSVAAGRGAILGHGRSGHVRGQSPSCPLRPRPQAPVRLQARRFPGRERGPPGLTPDMPATDTPATAPSALEAGAVERGGEVRRQRRLGLDVLAGEGMV